MARSLVALKTFPYASGSLTAGDRFDAVSDMDARLLIETGMAVADGDVEDVDPVALDEVMPVRRRRYRRALAAE